MIGFMPGGRVAVLLSFVLVTTAVMGVTMGAEAESRTEIDEALGETPKLDFEESEDTSPEFVPEALAEPLDLGIFPESAWYEQHYEAFGQQLANVMFTVAHRAALFGYGHRGFFGLSMVQHGIQAGLSLGSLGFAGLYLRQMVRTARGVDG